ncbi:hypothetical protein [Ammoniphilus resinae]|uniref:Uncharacterized protein n=1 Tax=Ammoniphilus resinae TaxID=861532 RepID=A0ABS4GJ76_9BACL|nr:hypothetical protein [Ammoniphilus resinae]MBP1930207.1 hypothetical protein [Ammoniphilus resinae]
MAAKLWEKLTNIFKQEHDDKTEKATPTESNQAELPVQTYILTLLEQMQLMNIVDRYLKEFEREKIAVEPGWEKGYSLHNEVVVTNTAQQIYRSNLEVFYQVPGSSEKKAVYHVSLVKYPEDTWRVLQVKMQ